MHSFAQDVRYAIRTLGQNKVFATIAVLCVALGIAVNTTVFSIANAAFLRRLPFDLTGRLVYVDHVQPTAGILEGLFSLPNYREIVAGSSAFEATGAVAYRYFTLTGSEEPEQVDGLQVTASILPMVGARPALGRLISEADDRPGAERVVLLGDELWRRRFNGDPTIVGTSITVDAAPHTVIGVMPPKFEFPETQQMWIPLAAGGAGESRGNKRLDVLAVLRPGMPMAEAEKEMAAVSRRLEEQYPATNRGWVPRVRPARSAFVGDETTAIVAVMMGAVGVVLLIACAHVDNVLLARAA